MITTTSSHDRIMSLVTAYTSALAYAEEVNRATGGMSDEDYDALASKTHYPLRQALIESTEVATTAEGACAALALAMHEYEIGETPLIPRMMEAAYGYFIRVSHPHCRRPEAEWGAEPPSTPIASRNGGTVNLR